MRRSVSFSMLAVLLLLGSASRGVAEAPRHSLEFAWRWAASPLAYDGARVLDTVELGARIGIRGPWSVHPYGGVGVSYGSPWYVLFTAGAEVVLAPERDGWVPRLALGLAFVGEGVSSRGQDAFRESFAADLALTLRGGVDYLFENALVGLDVRFAGMPRDALDVHGPLDVGAALRLGIRLPLRRADDATTP